MSSSAFRNLLQRTAPLLISLALVAGIVTRSDAGKKDRDSESSSDLTPASPRAPYLQGLGRDSVLIAWRVEDSGSGAVDFGTSPKYGRTVAAQSDGSRRYAVLRDLEPGTRYFYRVRAGERAFAEGPGFVFQTDAGPRDRQFSFFATGDIGDEDGDQVLTSRSILRAEPRPELGILSGDIVYSKGRSRDYDDRLMRPWQELLCTIPVWPALGNHDWKSPPASNWEREWYLPNNEHYYSFDYANAHFIALDTRDGDLFDLGNQVAWLENDLRAHASSDWTFVYFHHPGITCTYKRNNEAVIEHFLPLFDRYKVDVVFTGHAHTYERLYPIRGGKTVDVDQDPRYTDPDGTIYIVSGAGAKVKEGRPTKHCGPTAFYRDRTILWTHVLVDGPRCTIRTLESANDNLVDEVSITKSRLATLTPRSP